MDLKEVFNAIGAQMLSDFEGIHAQIKHAGERGSEREAGLKSFLESYLPGRYAVSNGEIVDANGQTSRQCDLVVYDHSSCPLLLAGKDYRVFPAEPVFAAIEVKSVLTMRQLEDAVEKIRSVKRLERHNGPIAGVVFAYKSSAKQDAIGQIASRLQGLNRGLPPHEYIDLLCILDSGVINVTDEEGWTRVPKEPSERHMYVWHALEPPTLLWFFIHLLDLLAGQISANPHYRDYARITEIGMVSLRSPYTE